MPTDSSNALVQSAIRIGAAGLGAAVAGPLGGIFGGFVADAFGKSTAEFLKERFSSFGEEAAKKLLDTGTDSLTDRLSKPAPDLEALYRESLRESLAALRPSSTEVVPAADSISPAYIDWFDHWNLCLQSGVTLQLDPLRPGDLTPASLDGLFAGTLERLDAQGAAIAIHSTSILLQTRPIPPELLAGLQSRLPGKFHDSFSSLLVTEKYQQAWNQAELTFRGWLQDTLTRIDARTENIDRKTDLLPGMSEKLDQLTRMLAAQQAVNEDFSRRVEQSLHRDASDGVAGGLSVNQLVEESKRQAALIEQLQKQLAARTSEPGDAEFSRLLHDQDYDAALKLKSSQVEARAAEASKLARDLYELGSVHDLRFEWPQALDAYRRAWTIENKYDYGFSYGVFAQKLNHFDEAIKVYRALLDLPDTPVKRADTLNNFMLVLSATRRFTDAEKAIRQTIAIRRKLAQTDPLQMAEVAGAYNNLGNVLYQVQRNREAEQAHLRALAIRCRLSKTDLDANRPLIAESLINLGLLYNRMQRIAEAEKVYLEAISHYASIPPDRQLVYKPEYAAALNNIGFLYKDTERPVDAEKSYEGALEKYKALADANPEAYLPDVAMTLMNRANLYAKTDRPALAEPDFDEAIRIYRGLHKPNRDPYLPGLAQTLTNVGSLYYRTLRARLAMKAYRKSIAIYYRLTKASPEVYLPEYADVLNNLGNLYVDQGRTEDGLSSLDKSRQIYSRLAASDPDVFRPTLARVLNNLGRLYFRSGNLKDSASFSAQAETVLTPYWQKFPAVHSDQMSRILLLRTLIAETAGNSTDARGFALRALPLAYDSAVKGAVQAAIARLLPGGAPPG